MKIDNVLAFAALGGLLAGASACNNKQVETKEGASKASTAPADAASAGAKHECKGKNECKGQGGCKADGMHECKGKNECKGQGGCAG